MDRKLIAWARAVKERDRAKLGPPRLWLFTDSVRMPDPVPVVRRLPVGLSGVVLRHDASPDRAAIAEKLARICRSRRLELVVAGDWRLAERLGAGVHLRGGYRCGAPPRRGRVVTSSAHSVAELRRAAAAGAGVVFLSPVFATASHPGAPSLGPIRWGCYVRRARLGRRVRILALGGVTWRNVHRLPRFCAGVGAIEALM